ncbi:retinol dehydrogenase 13-like [Xenia sp. Carnegie-2017]|uniref:retinol dehydrogenase 13-like n=2 Tax=Xenia sp. Carnegie-2017 TaxID=2897299 RepID=UPI001F04E864|nr:retinol dehydrogenase 13-like [Xenia sp. Carnegie-2017]XP_046860996.1 retinol dehydrogenase 13-like [Xenia sp. Carnegie-2017]
MGLFFRLAAFVALLGLTFPLLRKYIAGGVCTSKATMKGKTVIITGANAGIGKSTAIDLASRGARIIMACRSLERGQAALNDIVKQTGNNDIILKHLDLSSFKSVRKFAEEIYSSEEKIDVLINNAGTVSTVERKLSEDGLELTMAVNHFGHFLLTNLLLDLLRRSAPSRIVVVSSSYHYSFITTRSLIKLDDLQFEKSYTNLEAYGQSKLANILFTRELAKRLKGTGVIANSLHPGVFSTEIGRDAFPQNFNKFVKFISHVVMKTLEEGAQTTIHLAVSEDVENVTGKYFVDCEETKPAHTAEDDDGAKRLWELSEKIVQLSTQE